MRTVIVMGLAIGLLPGLLSGADADKDKKSLQGTWTLSAGETKGKALSEKQLKGGKLVVKGDHYTVTLEGKEAVTGVQKIDMSEKINTIDITDDSGPHKDQTCLGIYELKGDEFRVAFAPSGKERPSKFTTTSDSGNWMHVWKRVKE